MLSLPLFAGYKPVPFNTYISQGSPSLISQMQCHRTHDSKKPNWQPSPPVGVMALRVHTSLGSDTHGRATCRIHARRATRSRKCDSAPNKEHRMSTQELSETCSGSQNMVL